MGRSRCTGEKLLLHNRVFLGALGITFLSEPWLEKAGAEKNGTCYRIRKMGKKDSKSYAAVSERKYRQQRFLCCVSENG